MDSDEKAVLTTILYSDIFHFPLTLSEITNYLIHTRRCSAETVQRKLKKFDAYLLNQDNLYVLKECSEDISRRLRQKSFVKKKQRIAVNSAYHLRRIPTILFVGISGSLSVGSAQEDDDIDLFFICRRNTVWISRFLIVLFLSLSGVRRKRRDHVAPDKICANMFIDESALSFPKDRRDLYTAREILQLLPIFDREKTYNKLLSENSWTKSYLPNAKPRDMLIGHLPNSSRLSGLWLAFFEPVARVLQLFYMRFHITSETVTRTMIAFHPEDYRQKTLQSLREKQRKYNML